MRLSAQQEIQILHVDDEPSITDLTATFLEREDDQFSVETATSADEGLQHLGDRPPDCIVSDYNMPGMDGLEFLQAVREDYPDLPFILFTGKGSEEVASDAISAGVTDYLQKKSGTEQYELLANRIRNAVDARRETKRADRQEKLMRLTEFAGDTGGFELDMESETLLLTDGTRRLAGVPEDAHLNLEEAIELYHPDDQPDVRETINRTLEAGEQTRGTWRLRTRDNDERLVDVTMTPATGGDDVTTIRGAIHDITERRERREELEQIETVFNNAQDGLFLMNADEGFTTERVNPAYEETRGVAAEEVRGQPLREVLGERAGAVAERQCRECVERRESLELERTLQREGKQTHYVTRIAPVVVDGSVEYIAGSLRDVTAQRERQQELQRLQQAIDGANVPITLADPSKEDDPLVYVNDAFEDVTGYPPEEALGRNCRFLQGEDTDPEKITALRSAIDNGEPISLELRNYRKDGTEFWNRVTLTPIYDDSGDLVRYLGTQEDITERKERQRELRAERQFIEQALDALDDLFYVLDSDGTLRRWNDRVPEVTGYTDRELADMDAIELFPEDGRETIAGAIETTLADGEATVEADLRTADGDRLPYEFTGAQLTDEDGTVTGLVGVGRDLTERRQRERRFQALVEESNDVISIVDAEGVFQYQSPSIERVLGYDPTETIGDTAWEYVHPDDRADLIEAFERGVADPDANPLMEYRARHADGSWRWFEARGNNQLDNPAVEGYIINSRDVTEKEEREQELSLFFEESPLGAIQWDEEFRFERMNDRAEEILGYSETELHGEPWERIVADDDRERVGDAVESLLDADGGRRVINDNVRKDGETLICEWHNRAVTDADGTVESVFSKFQDVTERERRKRELQEYETVIETLSDAVYVVDEDGRFRYVNEEFTELVGYDTETIIGNTPSLIKDGNSVERAEYHLGRLLSSNGPETVTFEVTIQPRTGDPIVCEDHMCVLPYDGEEFDGSVGVLRDITEHKQYEQELEAQNERLEEFASIVSHDLRNPLGVAEGHLKLAEGGDENGHPAKALDAIARSQALIDDLLTLAREGDQVDEVEAVDLGELAKKSWQSTETPQATLNVDESELVEADRDRLRELFENLYRNAVEHGGDDVTVHVGAMEDGFCVADTGSGIPESARDEIFEAGYSTADDGTGFGLRIVEQIAKAHGWEVSVTESTEGGARFDITGIRKLSD